MVDSTEDATILVVDDEREVADAYALRLRTKYDVETAYGGEDALSKISEDVDIVLLDRRMPDMSGDEVLQAIRDRGYEARVVMVTAVDPDFDLLDMPFDDYLCKPVDKDSLYSAIEQQLQASEYHDNVSEYFAVTAKQSLLEQEKMPQELEDNEQYQQLKRRAEELRGEMDQALDDFDDMALAFMDIDRGA